MPLAAGKRLGPYEILAPIGAGGMGEVYRAHDTRLGRDVAIKVSAERFSARFEREAQAIAALNHPNICTLHDVGPDYLVMEYVEGQPLKGPLPLAQVLEYARQILMALDAAHSKGITHRDLKPGNILVAKAGVKLLDFGLAKTAHISGPEDETGTTPLTGDGVILGTLQYMSPEQVEGKPADARSDIFAFGLVLYEMITGQRVFDGGSKASLIAAILKEQPRPMQELVPLTPKALDLVVQRCLEKDAGKRWQSARDVQLALEFISLGAPAAAAVAQPRRNRWIWPAIAAALAVVALSGAWLLWPKPVAPARASRFQITLPDNVQFSEFVSISPDGHKLVFNATGSQSGLWIRDMDTLEWRKLAGTEGGGSPFWSPDSQFIGFSVGNQLKKIEAAGGPPQTLCSVEQRVGTGSWSRDGMIVFGSRGTGPMRRILAAGGVPTDITVLDPAGGETIHALPTFLPDGKHFLYLRAGSVEASGIYAGSLDAKPSEQSRERILAATFGASYVGGNLFFMREGTLMVQPFDAGKLQLRGEPTPVVEHVGTSGRIGNFSVSSSGALVYRPGVSLAAGSQVTWFDRQGKRTGTFGQPDPDQGLVLSPDATRAAGRDAPIGDLWLLDFSRSVRTRLTFHQANVSFPVWAPDGGRIIFAGGIFRDTIYEKAASGSGDEKELVKRVGENEQPTSWSRDGRFLIYTHQNAPKTGTDLWVLPLEASGGAPRRPVLLLGTEFSEEQGVFSPDGRWIAYRSNETGRPEIYVRPFNSSGPSLGDGKWQVSKDGGAQPKWRADSKEIIFRAPDGSPIAVDVSANGGVFQAGLPKQLFAAPTNQDWDVTADGKRLLMLVSPAQQNLQTPITVVLNWQADLKH